MIDLRSDTVTKPTPAMRRAMAEAEVGDDVYREDPTVNRLEERAAEILGKEAALFVPTGSMGNSIAIKLHTHHGQEVICDNRAHVLDWELAMMAWFSGCVARVIPTPDGILSWDAIAPEIRPHGGFHAPTGLITIEHPHNMGGGSLYEQDVIEAICTGALGHQLKVHMDGARLFHAVTATGIAVDRIVREVDTVMTCLSKGLGAPVGSLLAGNRDAMARARHYRKQLGGGMRQAGVLAAAGLVALEEGPKRLREDHDNARFLAEGLAGIPGIQLDPRKVVTNIVFFDVSATGLSSHEISKRLAGRGVLANGVGAGAIRMVTHRDVNRDGCERALLELGRILSAPHEAAGV